MQERVEWHPQLAHEAAAQVGDAAKGGIPGAGHVGKVGQYGIGAGIMAEPLACVVAVLHNPEVKAPAGEVGEPLLYTAPLERLHLWQVEPVILANDGLLAQHLAI